MIFLILNKLNNFITSLLKNIFHTFIIFRKTTKLYFPFFMREPSTLGKMVIVLKFILSCC